jgi:hypothetical protein
VLLVIASCSQFLLFGLRNVKGRNELVDVLALASQEYEPGRAPEDEEELESEEDNEEEEQDTGSEEVIE